MYIRQKHSPVNLDKQVQPTYRKTLAERTLCSSIYITNETNTRNKAGMKLLFVHVLYLSYTRLICLCPWFGDRLESFRKVGDKRYGFTCLKS